MAITIEQAQEENLKQEALTVVQRAALVKIVDQQTYDAAAVLLTEKIIPFRKRWKEYWEQLRKPAYEAYQAVLDKFSEGDKPAERAEKQVKAAIRDWDIEQERIRQELQRKAQEEAEERERQERLAAAVMAEDSGASVEEVEAITAAPVIVVAPPVEPTYQKVSGVSRRANWKCKVTDLKKLCAAIGRGQVPTEYVIPNESALNARAKADKGTLNIPGCVAYDDPIVSGRAK